MDSAGPARHRPSSDSHHNSGTSNLGGPVNVLSARFYGDGCRRWAASAASALEITRPPFCSCLDNARCEYSAWRVGTIDVSIRCHSTRRVVFTLLDSVGVLFTGKKLQRSRGHSMHDSDQSQTLADCLDSARKAQGSPSLRAIAARTDYSHTTVAKAFSQHVGDLSWPVIEQVGVAIGADTALLHQLWIGEEDHPDVAVDAGTASVSRAQGLPLVLWIVVLFCGAIAMGVMQAVDDNVAHTTLIADLVQILFMTGTTAILIRRAIDARNNSDRPSTLFFSLLAAGAASWTSRRLMWLIQRQVLGDEIPTGLLANIGFFLMPVCIGAALWMSSGQHGAGNWRRPWRSAVTCVGLVACPYTLAILMLTALGLRTDGPILLYAILPAADIALAMMALAPMICGYRIFGSAVSAIGLLAAAASDVGYLLLRADPEVTVYPPTAALGYVVFTIAFSVYALISRPLPASIRPLVPLGPKWLHARDIVAVGTGISCVVALGTAAGVIRMSAEVDVGVVMFVITIFVGSALALFGIVTPRY